MRQLLIGFFSFLYAFGSPAVSPKPAIDPEQARAAFAEARALFDRDAGRLWSKPLYGPMMFVDESTREIAANQPDGGGLLHRAGDIYTGKLPVDQMMANTALEFSGKRWTMVIWPLPEGSISRQRLLAHELFHRIQPEIGIPYSNAQNPQLDTLEGRYWLQLEWRALALALLEDGAAQAVAVRDALAFRNHRHSLFPGSAETERSLEINEGLAEYTGVSAASPDLDSARWRAANRLTAADTNTFVRSFAYSSGPGYGLLLDQRVPGWRSHLAGNSDLAVLLGSSPDLKPAAVQPVEERAKVYGGVALLVSEKERDVRTQKAKAGYRALLVDGPNLTLPGGEKFNYSFDPNELIPLGDLGTIVPTMSASDAWGTLQANEGALLGKDGKMVLLAAPTKTAGPHITGPGWILELAPGWEVVPATRAGSYTLKAR